MNVKQLKDKDGNAIQPNSPDKVGYFGTTGTSMTVNVEHTATEDGWMYLLAKCSNGQGAYGKINGSIVFDTDNHATGEGTFVSMMIPIHNGDKYGIFQKLSYPLPELWECWFRPNRTALGGGSLTP